MAVALKFFSQETLMEIAETCCMKAFCEFFPNMFVIVKKTVKNN
jgi:hypothetical protein